MVVEVYLKNACDETIMTGQLIILPNEKATAAQAAVNGDEAALIDFLKRYKHYPDVSEQFSGAGFDTGRDDTENARQIISSTDHFNNWADFEVFRHHALQAGSAIRQFEQAIDAIVVGNIEVLKQLLGQNTDLYRMRSLRKHRATLLIYLGANGVEWHRQKTPKNAAQVVELLLQAGAEVDAVGDMYGGTTTLGLVATSVHPVVTGVQEELMDVLIRHGANPNSAVAPEYTEGMLILACLANGRDEPLEYLVKHGASLDLEGACGVGDLEKVKTYFNADGSLNDNELTLKRDKGFIWACGYGRANVVEYLLATGVNAATEAEGMTAMHWAAMFGHLEIVKLLLAKNAPLEEKNSYGNTVLGQVLWSAYNQPKPKTQAVIETLIAAGAKVEDDWRWYIDELRGKSVK